MEKAVRFKAGGNRPDIGTFEPGELRVLPGHIADEFIGCGLAEEGQGDSPSRPPAAKKKNKEEVTGHGG